ncbi:MAG: hypothetical protein U0X92_10485 [Anaerolineales bacterium]
MLLSKNLLSPSPLIIAIQVLALAPGVWARRTFQAGQFSTHAEVKDGQLLVKDRIKLFVIPSTPLC